MERTGLATGYEARVGNQEMSAPVPAGHLRHVRLPADGFDGGQTAAQDGAPEQVLGLRLSETRLPRHRGASPRDARAVPQSIQ